jgi:hypothetical protein
MLTRRHLLAGAAALAAGVPEAGAQSTLCEPADPHSRRLRAAGVKGVDIVARLLQEPMKSALWATDCH